MKRQHYIFALVLTFVVEVFLFSVSLGKIEHIAADPVVVNECLKSVEVNYGSPSEYKTGIDYVIIDNDGAVVFKTRDGLSESINDAVKNSETILDITSDDQVVAKMIVHDESVYAIKQYKTHILRIVLIISFVQVVIFIVFYLDVKKKILDPFQKMQDFAGRVAGGDLDVPLTVDRSNVFGDFTEAFDIMRSEIKSARVAEKNANDEKKEMVAKLSHDIKTPVASIKSTSEIGYELSQDPKIKEYFNLINVKADQITVLVDNLFNSSVNDITEIPVSPSDFDSNILYDIIRNSDHLNKAGGFSIPECRIFVDKLRLQQAFDNIFMNSYKYADTEIEVTAATDDEYLRIRVRDKGPGVTEDELPLLKNKYSRGANATDKDGAGLGLYLANYFIENMNGRLLLENADPGLAVTFCIRTI